MATVAIYYDRRLSYPSPPFNPPKRYPEYPFSCNDLDPKNLVYEGIRTIFYMLGFDKENYGSKNWNPLRGIIPKNGTVVIKPNFVISDLRFSCAVHPSVLRPIIDYVFLATGHDGKIIIGEGPAFDERHFTSFLKISGLLEMISYLQKFKVPIELVDFRDHIIIDDEILNLDGDPRGYSIIDLKVESELNEFSEYRTLIFPGLPMNKQVIFLHHNKDKHEYSVANSVLDADCIISIAKLKTHRKTGVSLCLKNMIGITNMREWLPHHRRGRPPIGDEYCEKVSNFLGKYGAEWYANLVNILRSKLQFYFNKTEFTSCLKILKRCIKSMIYNAYEYFGIYPSEAVSEGSWYGNDTLWRVILDLNKIVQYCGKDKTIHKNVQRETFCIIDGIIAGEGMGPMEAKPKKCHILIGGSDPVAVDTVSTILMGIDPNRVPLIKMASKLGINDVMKIKVLSNTCKVAPFKFKLPVGWKIVKLSNWQRKIFRNMLKQNNSL